MYDFVYSATSILYEYRQDIGLRELATAVTGLSKARYSQVDFIGTGFQGYEHQLNGEFLYLGANFLTAV